jgi:hypothetical protein
MSLDSWFSSKNKTKILYLKFKEGIQIENVVQKKADNNNINIINLNPLYNKSHLIIKKKFFLEKIEEILTKKNINSFFNTRDDIYIIHNAHVFDKSFFESLNKMSAKFCYPVVLLIDLSLISERFASYILKDTKNTKTYEVKFNQDSIKKYINDTCEECEYKITDKHFEELLRIKNMYQIKTALRELIFTKKIDFENNNEIKIDKHVVQNAFKLLCNANIAWSEKVKNIKTQISLFKMLMPLHVVSGLDSNNNISFDKKFDIIQKCFESMAQAEKVSDSTYSIILKYLIPATLVPNQTLKGITMNNSLSNKYLKNDESEIYIHFLKATKFKLNQKCNTDQTQSLKIFNISFKKQDLIF